MRKFFILEKQLNINEKYLLTKDDSHHYEKVLRGNIKNEELIICDGKNHNFNVIVIGKVNEQVQILIKDEYLVDNEPNTKIHLYPTLIKAEKFDYMLQKCSEVGVFEITPIFTQRCMIKLDNKKIEKKINRWNRIVVEACKQCQRSYIPIVNQPIKFEKAIKQNKDGIIAYVDEKKLHIKQAIKKSDDFINVFIGPEGGFTEDEVDFANKNNIKSTHLGSLILRAETAAVVATSVILYEKTNDEEKQ
ncbi:MAG: 16S rRNA (uracil(1498)-N(3))-methyltransferase [Clostridiales bacterium]|nr:16S rRNA (uracil(1498)-N(3))-methyltransferase [Clostridiales bacterium]